MEFLQGTERTKTIWGRLLMVAMFGSYILACLAHGSPMPIVALFALFVAVGLFYYMPLRFIFWMLKGSGEITVPILAYLPFIFITILGFGLIFSPPMN